MPIRLALPQTTPALSMSNPTPSVSDILGSSTSTGSTFNTFVYSPYDFSQATLHDYITAPLIDGLDVIAPMMCVFFISQYLGWYVLRFTFPTRFLSMSTKEQRDLSIRIVAVVNGLICIRSAMAFFNITIEHGFTLHNYHFQIEDDKYRFSRLSIVAYFAWDLIVCVYYRWGALWVAHALASLIGVFGMASIPLSDHLGGYYSGVFELSNGLIHVAFLLRCMETCIPLATALEMLFAFLYMIIRVIGGTYVTGRWLYDMLSFYNTTGCANIGTASSVGYATSTGFALQRLAAGYLGLLPEVDESALASGVEGYEGLVSTVNPCPPGVFLIVMSILLSVVQILQYVWFVQIVRVGLGIGERDEPVSPSGSPVSRDKQRLPTSNTFEKDNARNNNTSTRASREMSPSTATSTKKTSIKADSSVVRPLHHTNGVSVVGNVPDGQEAVNVTSAFMHEHMPTH